MTKKSEMQEIMQMFEKACGVNKVKKMSVEELKAINSVLNKKEDK